MSLRKTSNPQQNESGLSLLQGLFVLAILGVVASVIVSGASGPTDGSYVVKPGDTLYKIARANNVDIENLKRWNNLTDPNQISVGQVLRLSSSGAGGAQTTPVTSSKPQPKPLDQGSAETPSSTGAGRPMAPSCRPSTATPRASTWPARWAIR